MTIDKSAPIAAGVPSLLLDVFLHSQLSLEYSRPAFKAATKICRWPVSWALLSQPSPVCSRESSPKSYGCLAPEGRHLECRGRKPTGPAATRALGGERTVHQHNLSHRAALGSMPSKAHHLRLDKSYRPWLTNCSPPGRPPPGNRGLAPGLRPRH